MSDEAEVNESSLYTKAYIKLFGVAVLKVWAHSRDLLPWEFISTARRSERSLAPVPFGKNEAVNNNVDASS